MALPSEGSELGKINRLTKDLGKSPCIELHGITRPLPKQNWFPPIVQRDDGQFEIGVDGLGPFPTRTFAEAVARAGGWS
jgi:hypothetical protein